MEEPTQEQIAIFKALQDIVTANLCAELDDESNFTWEENSYH